MIAHSTQYIALVESFNHLSRAREVLPFNCDLTDAIGRCMDEADRMMSDYDKGKSNV